MELRHFKTMTSLKNPCSQFSGGLGCVMLMVGLDVLTGLFQPK